MSSNLLYYKSLESHLDAYNKMIKQVEFNEEYQLMQNKIVREAELMNLSQADTMNRLSQIQEELKRQAENNLISLSRTNSPEIISKEEKYTPLTTSEYENVINKKPTYKVENRSKLIDEVKKQAENVINNKIYKAENRGKLINEIKKTKIVNFRKKLEPLNIESSNEELKPLDFKGSKHIIKKLKPNTNNQKWIENTNKSSLYANTKPFEKIYEKAPYGYKKTTNQLENAKQIGLYNYSDIPLKNPAYKSKQYKKKEIKKE